MKQVRRGLFSCKYVKQSRPGDWNNFGEAAKSYRSDLIVWKTAWERTKPTLAHQLGTGQYQTPLEHLKRDANKKATANLDCY